MTLIQADIANLLGQAIRKAQKKQELAKFELPEIAVVQSTQEGHGDYGSPICMQLARLARMAPVKIAERVIKRLKTADFIGQVEVVHPGFINVTLDTDWVARQVETILAADGRWGDVNVGQGQRVQVEFGSANPTGPLHVGFGRNVVLGDAIASLLSAAGYQVQREYYVNDAGSQMAIFGQSLYARYAQALGHAVELPENGYKGQYVVDWGQQIAQAEGDRFFKLEQEQVDAGARAIGKFGLETKVLKSVQKDVLLLNIHYDRWFHERELYDGPEYATIMRVLRQGDNLVEREGAVWFTATRYGVDKDEVIVRSSGQPGYFASDIAYHYNKLVLRGFDWVINVWGADHQGHVPRMKAMMQALDLDPERLTLVVYQLVTLKQDGQDVRLSKRAGNLVDLGEILQDVGPDAVRFFLLARDTNSQMEFDLDLAREQSDKNPVYYVQYAHARIASILLKAQEMGALDWREGDVSLLTVPAEQSLIRKMLALPEVINLATSQLAPHHLTYYAQELAAEFHGFYRDCRVLSSDPAGLAVTLARLKLVQATRQVLARVLQLMGMSAPERM